MSRSYDECGGQNRSLAYLFVLVSVDSISCYQSLPWPRTFHGVKKLLFEAMARANCDGILQKIGFIAASKLPGFHFL